MVSDACTSGLLSGITVTNHFQPVNGRDMLKVTGLSAMLQHDYGFDTYGRLSSAASGVYSANYGYLASSDWRQPPARTTAQPSLRPHAYVHREQSESTDQDHAQWHVDARGDNQRQCDERGR
jgi:hypothetical protein